MTDNKSFVEKHKAKLEDILEIFIKANKNDVKKYNIFKTIQIIKLSG